MAEQLPLKQLVEGSNPPGVTKRPDPFTGSGLLVLISGLQNIAKIPEKNPDKRAVFARREII